MKYKLRDLINVLNGYAFKSSEFVLSGVPVIKIKNIVSNNVVLQKDTKFVSELYLKKLPKYILKKQDIIISMTGSHLGQNGSLVGKVGRVKLDKKCLMNQRVGKIEILNENILDKDYLFYWISRKKIQKQLASCAGGSANQANISINDIYNLKIDLPSIESQRIISQEINLLEEKKRLNVCINDNLLESSLTLFDKYFKNIEKGTKTIKNYISPHKGKALLSKNAKKGDVPVIAGGISPSVYHNQSNTKEPVVTISASGANAGYINLWTVPVWSSDSSFIDESITNNVYFWYILLKKRQNEIFDLQTGSAQPHIYPKQIENMPIKEINFEEITNFNNLITPFFENYAKNLKENTYLRKIKNNLIQKSF